jgi:hypothetical protein
MSSKEVPLLDCILRCLAFLVPLPRPLMEKTRCLLHHWSRSLGCGAVALLGANRQHRNRCRRRQLDMSNQDILIEGVNQTAPGCLILQDMRAECLLEILLNFSDAYFSYKPERNFAKC